MRGVWDADSLSIRSTDCRSGFSLQDFTSAQQADDPPVDRLLASQDMVIRQAASRHGEVSLGGFEGWE